MAKKRNVDPIVARLRAQKGAHARWARHDPVEGTAAARAAYRQGLRAQVLRDARARGEDSLTSEEIDARTRHLLMEHMRGMALRSKKARASRTMS